MTILTDVRKNIPYEGNNVFSSFIQGANTNTTPATCNNCGGEYDAPAVVLSDTLGEDDKSEVPGTGETYVLHVHRCLTCDPAPTGGRYRLVTKPSNDAVIYIGPETMHYRLDYPGDN